MCPSGRLWEFAMISFGIEPEVADQLEWIRSFVAEEIEPIDLAFGDESVIYDKSHAVHATLIRRAVELVTSTGVCLSGNTPSSTAH